jgi:hypothetical protein
MVVTVKHIGLEGLKVAEQAFLTKDALSLNHCDIIVKIAAVIHDNREARITDVGTK